MSLSTVILIFHEKEFKDFLYISVNNLHIGIQHLNAKHVDTHQTFLYNLDLSENKKQSNDNDNELDENLDKLTVSKVECLHTY